MSVLLLKSPLRIKPKVFTVASKVLKPECWLELPRKLFKISVPRPYLRSIQSGSLGLGPGLFFFKASQVTAAHSEAENPGRTRTPRVSDIHLPRSFLRPLPGSASAASASWHFSSMSETLPSQGFVPTAPPAWEALLLDSGSLTPHGIRQRGLPI